VAGVTRDSIESNRSWARRLRLPYPLLADEEGLVGEAFGVRRRIGLGGWNVDFFKRATFLIDLEGTIAAVWREVRVRGHALEVLEMAKTVSRSGY
jgi:peroxiredoxin Q/BCP